LTDNFDDYWRIASKVFPSTFSPPANNNSSPPLGPSRSHSTDVSTGSTNNDRDGAYNVRSIPVRIHLPDGPVLQDLVPPVNEEGAYDIKSVLT
jgi:autophagy-related protein 5